MDPTLALAKENTSMAHALVAKVTALEEENKKLKMCMEDFDNAFMSVSQIRHHMNNFAKNKNFGIDDFKILFEKIREIIIIDTDVSIERQNEVMNILWSKQLTS
tara:strand:+ start:269 stop:580 length:312 start_codon:yes stop_codon:yes gene_type:complete